MGLFDFFRNRNEKSNSSETGNSNAEPHSDDKTRFEIRYSYSLKNGLSKDHVTNSITTCEKNRYDGEESKANCEFCKKIVELDRFWTRREIEEISQRLGYSVFDRAGGAVDKDGNNICAFHWKSEVLIRRK